MTHKNQRYNQEYIERTGQRFVLYREDGSRLFFGPQELRPSVADILQEDGPERIANYIQHHREHAR